MTPLLISMRRLIFLLVLIHSASLYKIYASDESSSNEELNQALPIKNLGYGNDDYNEYDKNNDNSETWLSHISDMKQHEEPEWKRSIISKGLRSLNLVPQRRNYRTHWNPLVAAYKRCGELSTPEERESCFKNAIQMLFVHKLRK
jgi:hypothetical protein